MFKNVRKKIIYIGVFIILLVIGLVIYSENIKKINIIENIKKAIEEENSSNTTDEITTIYITGITAGKETEHEHIYKTMYDENNHWEECTACGEKRNEANHSITTTWALGYESCDISNLYTSICNCGYTKKGYKPCVWSGRYFSSLLVHTKICDVHNDGILKKQYYENEYGVGKLYYTEGEDRCYKSKNNKITCNNLGTCYICGKKYITAEHFLDVNTSTNKIYCRYCNQTYGKCTYELTKTSTVPVEYTMTTKFSFTNGAVFDATGWTIVDTGEVLSINEYKVISTNADETEVTLVQKIKGKSSIKEPVRLPCNWWAHAYINKRSQINITPDDIIYNPDFIAPEIVNISIEQVDEWKKSRTITISGTENWTNTVKVKILNDENKEIYTGETTVKNKKYSISCTPELEAGLEERIFKAIVTDACGNQTEQEFTISKIDGTAPTVTSSDKVTSSEWAREKTFTFTAEDLGIGDVQIGFNDVNDYSLAIKDGTNYSKQYKFVGDAYSPVNASVYFKDGLGNVTTQTVTLEKIDGTAPTITSASIHNNKINMQAHDRHETLGEGSGVAKYRYITSTTKLENPEITSENSTEVNVNEIITIPEIYKVKYVYIIAEDLVRKHRRSVRSRSTTARTNKQSKHIK